MVIELRVILWHAWYGDLTSHPLMMNGMDFTPDKDCVLTGKMVKAQHILWSTEIPDLHLGSASN